MQTSRGAPRERDACRCRLSGVPFVLWNLVSAPDAGTRGRRLVPGILSHNFLSFPSDQRQQIDGRRKVIGVWVVFPVIAFFFFFLHSVVSLYIFILPPPRVCVWAARDHDNSLPNFSLQRLFTLENFCGGEDKMLWRGLRGVWQH